MHSWITCCRVSTLPEKYSRSVFYSSYISGKDALTLFCHFQDCYCYSNSDVMCHVTKYCNMIVSHCTVQWDTSCTYAVYQTPSLAEVGRARETTYCPRDTTNIDWLTKWCISLIFFTFLFSLPSTGGYTTDYRPCWTSARGLLPCLIITYRLLADTHSELDWLFCLFVYVECTA